MTEFKASKARSSIWATLLVCLAALVVSCAANGPSDGPRLYGERSTESTGNSTGTLNTEKDSTNATEATAAVVQTAESSLSKTSATNETPATASKADPNVAPATSGVAPTQAEEQQSDLDELLLYFAEVDTEDSASAVDDQIWRLFDLAEEYYQMGVIANREASWEEAQYYFEKSLKILANLDIEDDSLVTPEAVKYSSLLDNLIADYRVTLRSLGQLEGDIAPSVLVERFGEVGGRLGNDSLVVFKQEQTAITFDLPVKMNDRVKKSIIYYQTVAPDFIYKTLKRSQRYDALFRETLTKHNMPQDLVYLSMVESGFNPHAYSWARAMGLWQFISSTGRMYGLNRSWWVDERKDPVKATDAACRFLKDLYNKFGDWELAMAAYNGGPGRVSREIKKQKTIDFWRLRLRRQTMDYVPLIYAAAIICKDPEKYGFDLGQVEIEPPIVWDDVTIDRCLDLKVVASEVGCSVQELKDLNPEL
ncbi:MAG: lytic transglycosylase domain-containing protein, partial [candidate division Zixibacteria bacterium]|nr:lytic transglycosylase domain-containing protein [candidate division Zixibacteria bacterium]